MTGDVGESAENGFTDAQRAEYRGLARSMAILGAVQLLLGGAWGVLWALTRAQAVPLQFGAAGVPERMPWLMQAVAVSGFGALTVRAAGSFRRVARASKVSAATMSPAVERLNDLYQAQIGILVFAVGVGVLSAL